MGKMKISQMFNNEQIDVVNQAVTMAEELVSNYYKMSDHQWLHPKYDVKTIIDLKSNERVEGPFAQIIRYEGKRKGSSLGSDAYDFYKVCLQDNTILAFLEQRPHLAILPFCLYIITHELVHIVRFSKFLQSFDATAEEKLVEEHRVHEITHRILFALNVVELQPVLDYFRQWRDPLEGLIEP
jgi:hypothetical protein